MFSLQKNNTHRKISSFLHRFISNTIKKAMPAHRFQMVFDMLFLSNQVQNIIPFNIEFNMFLLSNRVQHFKLSSIFQIKFNILFQFISIVLYYFVLFQHSYIKIFLSIQEQEFSYAIFQIRFSGFKHCNWSSTNLPSFLISTSSNQISPPPNSGVWHNTKSQWTALLLPFGASS